MINICYFPTDNISVKATDLFNSLFRNFIENKDNYQQQNTFSLFLIIFMHLYLQIS